MALLSLRMIFSWGIEQRWLTHNPAASVKAPRALPKPADDGAIWTPREYDAFRQHADSTYATGTVAAARDPWVRAGMRLTLCGPRRSEVFGLDWSHVDLSGGTVAVVA